MFMSFAMSFSLSLCLFLCLRIFEIRIRNHLLVPSLDSTSPPEPVMISTQGEKGTAADLSMALRVEAILSCHDAFDLIPLWSHLRHPLLSPLTLFLCKLAPVRSLSPIYLSTLTTSPLSSFLVFSTCVFVFFGNCSISGAWERKDLPLANLSRHAVQGRPPCMDGWY